MIDVVSTQAFEAHLRLHDCYLNATATHCAGIVCYQREQCATNMHQLYAMSVRFDMSESGSNEQ
jgi:hypothetical protein